MIVLPENKEKTKEKLIKMYPEFLRDIKEFTVIQEAIADTFVETAEAVKIIINDSNLTTASESIIEFFEKLIGIKRSSLRTLEERRRLVLAYYNIFGKVSATKLKNAIGYYTQEDVAVSFNTKDEDGNYILKINCERGNMNALFLEDIELLLKKIIPAHLLYRVGLKYSFAVVIGKKKKNYNYEYELCGTKPDIALLGDNDTISSVTEIVSRDYVMDYALCGTMTAGS